MGLRGLGRYAVDLQHVITDRYRPLAEANPDAYLPDLATALNNLSIRLGDLGRGEQGLAVIEEAVHIRRTLAQANPDAHLRRLANSLGVLAEALEALDRPDEAQTTSGEATWLFRQLDQP